MSDKHQTPDKIDLHYRQQLSALIDGALAPEEARFLLRRMQHDHELAECWERWLIAGEVLRGRATAVLPAGFALRVGEAIAADSATTLQNASAQPRSRWTRWGGSAALAASVAVVAMLVLRQAPDADTRQQQVSPIVAATPASAVESPTPVSSATAQAGAEQPRVMSAAASIAVADAPRRTAQRTRPPMQRPRAEARMPAEAIAAARTEVAAAPAVSTSQSPRPFVPGTLPAARPWPRAVLPQFGASGALTADTDASASPSFYPFEPRLPGNAAEPDTVTPQPR